MSKGHHCQQAQAMIHGLHWWECLSQTKAEIRTCFGFYILDTDTGNTAVCNPPGRRYSCPVKTAQIEYVLVMLFPTKPRMTTKMCISWPAKQCSYVVLACNAQRPDCHMCSVPRRCLETKCTLPGAYRKRQNGNLQDGPLLSCPQRRCPQHWFPLASSWPLSKVGVYCSVNTD